MMRKDFPLGHATSYVCWRMILGFMLSAILLPMGVASAGVAYHLAQIPTPEAVEALAGKSLSYWFIALALFSISSWTVIVKWLLGQLLEQRMANTKATTELISYMKEDHTSTKILLEKVENSHTRLADVLNRITTKP